MGRERTYTASMGESDLEELLQYGSTQLQVGDSTYVDVRLNIRDHEDMKEYAELLGEMTVSMAWESGIARQQEKE